MAASVTGSMGGTLITARTPDAGYYSGKADQTSDTLACAFRASGVLADQVDLRYVKRLTFASSTQQTINLSAAVGDDGVTSAFARVRAILIRCRSTADAASLTIDNAGATNPFVGFLNAAGTLKVYPSTVDPNDATALKNHGFAVLTAPHTTGAAVGTGVNLRLLPSAHAFDADVVILGCSA